MPPAPRKPTLRDVGKLANVDASIASRVLSGEPRRVSEETRLRIFAAAEELHWRPHPAAKSLRTGATSTLALIVPNIHNPAYGSMISGAQRAAASADHVMVFADMENVAADEVQELRRISAHVDGIVIASARTDAIATEFMSTLAPTVLLNRRGLPGLPAVVGPDERGAAMAAEHLHELGHRRIAILSGPATVDTATRREGAFGAALAERGTTPLFSVKAELDVEAAAAVIAPILRLTRDERPTAIFAAALTAGLGVLVAARRAGLRVPEDLSIIGFDDALVAELVTPALTTIRMPHEQMGLKAVESLLELMRGAQLPETITVAEQPELVLRGSTAAPSVQKEKVLE